MNGSAAEGLKAQNVSVIYKNGVAALREADLSVPKGSITALVGVNGSGKSTLFKAIMGFVRLETGSIRINGEGVAAALAANRVAYVPQTEEVDWSFPVLVRDVVMMGRYGRMGFLRWPSARDREVVEGALQRVEMQGFATRQIGELSGGQRKRVFLARALAQQADVILLDEPFTGVDVKTEEAIILLLKALRDEGRIILVSTHNLGSVPEYCDRAALLKGTVIAEGAVADIFTTRNLERAFGGQLRHFVIGGADLHDDDDTRTLTVISDDERPFVVYGDRSAGKPERENGGNGDAA
jgi:manganese/iron transport system ATP-binding protein